MTIFHTGRTVPHNRIKGYVKKIIIILGILGYKKKNICAYIYTKKVRTCIAHVRFILQEKKMTLNYYYYVV